MIADLNTTQKSYLITNRHLSLRGDLQVILQFTPKKMAPVGARSTWETYGAFLNSLCLKVKWLKLRHEQIKDRIDKYKLSVLFNQIYLKEKI